jgi:hypothetical protein
MTDKKTLGHISRKLRVQQTAKCELVAGSDMFSGLAYIHAKKTHNNLAIDEKLCGVYYLLVHPSRNR